MRPAHLVASRFLLAISALASGASAHSPHDVSNVVVVSPDYVNDRTVFGAFLLTDHNLLALDDEGNCGACMRDPEWIFARVRAARRGPEGECAAPCGALALCARHDQTATTTRILEGLEPVKVGLVRGSESH